MGSNNDKQMALRGYSTFTDIFKLVKHDIALKFVGRLVENLKKVIALNFFCLGWVLTDLVQPVLILVIGRAKLPDLQDTLPFL